ncbi:MAG: hypothetical protein NTX63_01685 [Candidatus Peregrinibacteria bacterium]|nr:hypothetical protein [Candidatus Peregrinibacteria bacterium]
MMNSPSLRNVLVAAALSLGISVDAAPAKNIAVRRQEMATKLQACLKVGFENYDFTGYYKDEKGNSKIIRSSGWLSDGKKTCERYLPTPKEGCPKEPMYVGGGRIQHEHGTKQKQVEGFIDSKPGNGSIKMFSDEISSNDGKDPRDKIEHVICYGRDAIPAKDQKVMNKMGIPDCTDTVSQPEAQKEYDDFMAEAASQCDYKAEIDVDFGNKLKKILKK